MILGNYFMKEVPDLGNLIGKELEQLLIGRNPKTNEINSVLLKFSNQGVIFSGDSFKIEKI